MVCSWGRWWANPLPLVLLLIGTLFGNLGWGRRGGYAIRPLLRANAGSAVLLFSLLFWWRILAARFTPLGSPPAVLGLLKGVGFSGPRVGIGAHADGLKLGFGCLLSARPLLFPPRKTLRP